MFARKTSQVLLSLLLMRETVLTQPEFAFRAGVVEGLLPSVLRVIEQAGLILIVPRKVNGADKEIIHDLVAAYVVPLALPLLHRSVQAHDQGSTSIGDRGAVPPINGRGQNGEILSPNLLRGASGGDWKVDRLSRRGGSDSGGVGETDQDADGSTLDLCRRADEAGNRTDQIKALQAAWDEAFPVDQYDYAYQRLTDATAKKFLVGRTAEEVAEVILDAPRRAGKQI